MAGVTHTIIPGRAQQPTASLAGGSGATAPANAHVAQACTDKIGTPSPALQ